MSDALTLNAGFGYLDAKYKSFPSATFTSITGAQTAGDASGNYLISAPKTSGNLSLDYSKPTNIGRLGAGIAVQYRDKIYVGADNRLQIPAYAVVNLTAGWTSNDERFSVKFWARNLFDKYYMINRTQQPLGDIQYAAPPRIIGVTLGFKTR